MDTPMAKLSDFEFDELARKAYVSAAKPGSDGSMAGIRGVAQAVKARVEAERAQEIEDLRSALSQAELEAKDRGFYVEQFAAVSLERDALKAALAERQVGEGVADRTDRTDRTDRGNGVSVVGTWFQEEVAGDRYIFDSVENPVVLGCPQGAPVFVIHGEHEAEASRACLAHNTVVGRLVAERDGFRAKWQSALPKPRDLVGLYKVPELGRRVAEWEAEGKDLTTEGHGKARKEEVAALARVLRAEHAKRNDEEPNAYELDDFIGYARAALEYFGALPVDRTDGTDRTDGEGGADQTDQTDRTDREDGYVVRGVKRGEVVYLKVGEVAESGAAAVEKSPEAVLLDWIRAEVAPASPTPIELTKLAKSTRYAALWKGLWHA